MPHSVDGLPVCQQSLIKVITTW